MAEYLIFTDESEPKGRHYRNFYAGVLVPSEKFVRSLEELEEIRSVHDLRQELKFKNVSANKLEGFRLFMSKLFELAVNGDLKIRTMFIPTGSEPAELTTYHRNHDYEILYYYFITRAFGLNHCDNAIASRGVRVLADQLPRSKQRVARLRGVIASHGQNPEIQERRLVYREDCLSEVDSRNQTMVQAADLVGGALQYGLNRKWELAPSATKAAQKRTLFEDLRRLVASTNGQTDLSANSPWHYGSGSNWIDPYRSWRFRSDYRQLKIKH